MAFSTSTADNLLLHFTQLHLPDGLACFRLSSSLYQLVICNGDATVTEAERKTKRNQSLLGWAACGQAGRSYGPGNLWVCLRNPPICKAAGQGSITYSGVNWLQAERDHPA